MLRRAAAVGLILLGAILVTLGGVAAQRTRLFAPEPSVLLRDVHGAYLGEVDVPEDGRLGFWPPGPGGERVRRATLAIEDRRFRSHPGVDLRAVGRALRQNLGARERVSGASTLPMQVARMQDPGPRTWTRKAIEAVTAMALVERFGHDALLDHYLTLAPYGNNVHGVRYAARRFFDKPLDDLTWAEAALLAGLPQAPGRMNPYTPTGRKRAVTRALRVLDALETLGDIDPTTHAIAAEELAHLRPLPRPARPTSTLHAVLALEGQASDHPERWTTLDLNLQEHLDAILVDHVTDWRDRGAEQGALMVIERETLAVRASIGSIGFEGTRGGSIDFTRTPRTPGSTLKPFLYAHALDQGLLAPGRILDDLRPGPGGVRNADFGFLGPLLPRQALANSRNVPAALLAEEVGLDALSTTFQELGLHDGSHGAEHYGTGLVLGGMPVQLVDLVRAYTALADDGELGSLRWFEDAGRAPGRQVIRQEHARLVRDWLADPTARTPTFPRAGFAEHGFPVALKTGTSPDHRDSWALAITDRYVLGIWIGHPDWRPMRGLTGYQGAGRVLSDVLEVLHHDQLHGFANRPFPSPDGWEQQTICALTGQLATAHCDTPRTEWFPPGEHPDQTCEAHHQERGRTVVQLPPRYAAWAETQHLPTVHPPLTATSTVALDVVSPPDGANIMADPSLPEGHSTLRLAVAVDPPVEQVVWWVDGLPFATVDYPYVARWPVEPGEHTFEARVARRTERSGTVSVQAR